MNYSSSFIRKIIYIALMGALLFPLSLVSRPATRSKENVIKDQGGVLARLRDDNELSQAKLSEIDPASETMKLASLGLRGLAVNLLWMQAIDAKEKQDWDTLTSTLNTLLKIQPTFIKVWKYQAHNLSYNVSVEFDDYEYRYHWVKKAINFLTEGIPLNRRDHRIVDELGLFTGLKIGTADEKAQYRQLFRKDREFHEDMGEFVNIDAINTPYEPDNWLLSGEYYRLSEDMVDKGVEGSPVPKRRKDMIFYQNRPAQVRNLVLALQDEFRSEEYMKSMWQRAHDEWMQYGTRPIYSSRGVELTMEGLMTSMKKVEAWRAELDELVPGARDEYRSTIFQLLSQEERDLLNVPLDQLDDEGAAKLRNTEYKLSQINKSLEFDIAERASTANRKDADTLAAQISFELLKIFTADKFRNTINYSHWKDRTFAEATDEAMAARQEEFDATELQRQSIFDEFVIIDPVTNEKTSYPGAIQKYDEAFSAWAKIIERHPNLKDGPLFEDLIDRMHEYMHLRNLAGLQSWPDDFPLQQILDRRIASGDADGLPTTEDVQEMIERRAMEKQTGGKQLPQAPDIGFPDLTGKSDHDGHDHD